MIHHPSCPARVPYTPAVACICPLEPRTLAGDMERLRFAVVSLLWRLTRSEAFWLVVVAVAIAGMVLGLTWGWLQ